MAVNSVGATYSFTGTNLKPAKEAKIREKITKEMDKYNITKDEYINLYEKKKKVAKITAIVTGVLGLFKSKILLVPAIFALWAMKANKDRIKVAENM